MQAGRQAEAHAGKIRPSSANWTTFALSPSLYPALQAANLDGIKARYENGVLVLDGERVGHHLCACAAPHTPVPVRPRGSGCLTPPSCMHGKTALHSFRLTCALHVPKLARAGVAPAHALNTARRPLARLTLNAGLSASRPSHPPAVPKRELKKEEQAKRITVG